MGLDGSVILKATHALCVWWVVFCVEGVLAAGAAVGR